MAKKNHISRQITTKKFRTSFVNVFTPRPNMQGDLKYNLSMIFDNKEDIAEIIQIVREVATQHWGTIPKTLKVPWSNGNDKKDKQTGEVYVGYENKIVVQTSSKQRVGIVDCVIDPATEKLHVLTTDEEFYGGCYAAATITAYTWENIGGQGVSIGLQNVQKIGDGEPFSGKSKAEDDFSPISKPKPDVTGLGLEPKTGLADDLGINTPDNEIPF